MIQPCGFLPTHRYVPRDSLEYSASLLDWNGDHVHTNFRQFFDEV
jgi:hypothetical protein